MNTVYNITQEELENSSSENLLNKILAYQEAVQDTYLSTTELIVEYCEKFELDIEEVGEILSLNKTFIKHLENELIQNKTIPSSQPNYSFDDWE